MRLQSLFILLTLCCLLILFHMAAGLATNIRLMQTYEPPTQIDRIEQDKLQNLEQRMDDVQNNQDEIKRNQQKILDIFSSADTYEITAYVATGNPTATGTTPTEGRTIAVDPRVIEYGTEVWIEGIGWRVAEDCGGAVKGKVIDVFMDVSRQEALRFGRRQRLVIPL